jgi:hypothetical protein
MGAILHKDEGIFLAEEAPSKGGGPEDGKTHQDDHPNIFFFHGWFLSGQVDIRLP